MVEASSQNNKRHKKSRGNNASKAKKQLEPMAGLAHRSQEEVKGDLRSFDTSETDIELAPWFR